MTQLDETVANSIQGLDVGDVRLIQPLQIQTLKRRNMERLKDACHRELGAETEGERL